MPLPQLGINEPVRVCDGCYIKLQLDKANIKTSSSTPIIPKPTTSSSNVPTTNVNTTSASTATGGEEFDDDIKKAIELSLKEAEQQKSSYGNGYVAPQQQQQQQQQREVPKNDTLEEDPDLAAAIAASLRDIEISKNNQSSYSQQQYQPQKQQVNKDELTPVEMENILLFSTLMDRVYASGGDVSNDSQINLLYTQIGSLQPKLVKNLDEIIQKRNKFIEIHEKLNMAVKAYDRLLEERIANVRQGANSGYNLPEQHYQHQPLYHQQQQPVYYPQEDTNKYYQTSAPPHDPYYNVTPGAPPQHNEPVYYPPQPQQLNNQDMSHYYSAPPQHHQQHQQQPMDPQQQKQPHVEEAPLIDL